MTTQVTRHNRSLLIAMDHPIWANSSMLSTHLMCSLSMTRGMNLVRVLLSHSLSEFINSL